MHRDERSAGSLLERVELFRNLDPSDLSRIMEAGHRRRVRAGATCFRQGAPASMFYVLVRGRVKLSQVALDGQEVVLRFVGPGQAFGGVAAFGEATYPVTSEAVEDTDILAWDGATMAALMEKYPRLALNALKFVAARYHELQVRFRQLASERAERRIARALVKLIEDAGRDVREGVRIDFPISRQDLAEMTGTTIYTVSRVLSAWEEAGIVSGGRRRQVTIRDVARLRAAAENG